jgi:glutamate synthase domain-containing protein 2
VAGIYPSYEKRNKVIGSIRGEGGLETPEILGPGHHIDLVSASDLKLHVELLREVTNYNIPVMVKIGAGDVYESTRDAIKTDADGVIVDMGLDPYYTPSSVKGSYGTDLLGSIPPAVRAFNSEKAGRKGVKLLVSGGFRNGADIVKALAMGADATGLSESAAVAIGCDLCGSCPAGRCKKGITTRDKNLKSYLNWKTAGQKLSRYLAATKKEIELLMGHAGVNSVKDLSNHHLRALTYDAAAITGLKLVGYDRELPMWFH